MSKNDKFIDGLAPRGKVRHIKISDVSAPVTVKRPKCHSRHSIKIKSSIPTPTPAPAPTPRVKTVAEAVRLPKPVEDETIANFNFPDDEDDFSNSTFEINDEELFSDDMDGRENIPPKSKIKKEKKKWSTKRKVLTFFSVLIFLAGVAVFIWGDSIIAKLTGGKSGLFDAFKSFISEEVTPLKTGSDGRTNILVFGTSGYDMDGSSHDGAQLTDSIMVISLDQEKNDVAMLSLPRDLKVGYTCTATGKINELYWCSNTEGNDEDGGARALISDVEDILGINIQYYAHMDWGALVQVVDALGGVTVTLDEDIADTWTNTYISAGVPTALNGESALGLARARHGTAYGDFSRGASQQKIMVGIKNRIVEQGLSLTDTINLLNALGDNLRTSFSMDEIKTAVKLVKDFPMENIRQVPLLETTNGSYFTTANINDISYVVPSAGVGNYKEIKTYIKKMFSSDPVLREDATIMVLNGSNTAGVAKTEASTLENRGLNIGQISNAPAGDYAPYTLYDLTGEKSATRTMLESKYSTAALSADNLPYGIYANSYDFVLIIGDSLSPVDVE